MSVNPLELRDFALDVIFSLTSKGQGPGRAGIRSVIRTVIGEERYRILRAAERKTAQHASRRARAKSTPAAASDQTGTTGSTPTARGPAGTTGTARSTRS
jgi:hypothetical protein